MKSIARILAHSGLMLVLCGCAATPTIRDTLLVKPIDTGNTGITQSTLLGGLGLDLGWKLDCDGTGGCTLFGSSLKSFGETTDFLLIHLNPDHTPQWARTYGGTNKEELQGVVATRDGGYLMFGASQSLFFTPLKVMSPSRIPRPFIVKLGHDGAVEWAKLVQFNDAAAQTKLFGAIQTADGGFVLVGQYAYLKNPKDTEWSPDMFALRLAADGKPVWMHRYHMGANYGIATSITSMQDGRIGVAAQYFDDALTGGLLVMTLSQDGSPASVMGYPGPLWPGAIRVGADGQSLVTGEYTAKGKPRSAFMLRLDQKGMPGSGHTYTLRNAVDTPTWVGGFSLRGEASAGRRIALVGHSGLADVVRGAQEPGDQALVLLLDEQGNVTAEAGVRASGTQATHQSNSEYTDIAPLGDGSFALLGSTEGFGAAYANFLFSIWTPHDKAASLFDVSGLDIQATPLPLPTVSDEAGSVENVPAQDVDVTEIKIGSPEQPQ
jgi:hypothetical protein